MNNPYIYALLLMVGGILAYYGILPTHTGVYGCSEVCLWVGFAVFLITPLIDVDWEYTFKKNNKLSKELKTIGVGIAELIFSLGILLFILSEFQIFKMHFLFGLTVMFIGGLVRKKYTKKQNEILEEQHGINRSGDANTTE